MSTFNDKLNRIPDSRKSAEREMNLQTGLGSSTGVAGFVCQEWISGLVDEFAEYVQQNPLP